MDNAVAEAASRVDTPRGATDSLDSPANQEPARGTNRRARSLGSDTLWAFVGSIVLAAVFARSALINLTFGIVGGNWDGYENAWDYWWLKTALFDLHRDPFYTDYLYYPFGISLRYHTLNPLNGLLTLPFNLILGYVTSVNLLFVASLALTTFFAFLLIRDIVGNPWAAFAAAGLFTFANHNVVGFLLAGQANLLAMEWLPLYLFFLLRALHGRPMQSGLTGGTSAVSDTGVPPRRLDSRWHIDLALALATLVFISLTDWQYVVFAVLITVLYFLFVLLARGTGRQKAQIFGKLALLGGVYALLIGPPLVLPMLQEALTNNWLIVSGQATLLSLDLVALVGPGLGNPGYLALILAGVGVWALWKKERGVALFWLGLAVLFSVLALGPVLLVGGADTGITMPYRVFQDLPVFNIGRNPRRFTLIASLAVAILSAFGIRALLSWLQARLPGRAGTYRLRLPATAAVVALFLAVSLGGFVAEAGSAVADPPQWPSFYNQLAEDAEDYTILELPPFTEKGTGENHYMFYQVVHGKKRFSGRWARDHKLDNPNNLVKRGAFFRQLWLVDYPEEVRERNYPPDDFLDRTDNATQAAAVLNYYKTRYIVLWKAAISEDEWPRYTDLLRQALGQDAQPYFEDYLMVAYRVPQALLPADPITLDVGRGWYGPETNAAGKVYRWANRTIDEPESELYTTNLQQSETQAELSFTIFAYKQPRTIHVALNGVELTSFVLKPEDGQKQMSVPIELPPGNSVITFSSPEAPLATDNPKLDGRRLSFGAYDVRLAP
jgi:hypothetical protein